VEEVERSMVVLAGLYVVRAREGKVLRRPRSGRRRTRTKHHVQVSVRSAGVEWCGISEARVCSRTGAAG
jgi:hypothetical protein